MGYKVQQYLFTLPIIVKFILLYQFFEYMIYMKSKYHLDLKVDSV